ncbi:unnamed protein product, partial [Schistosoma mattheei]
MDGSNMQSTSSVVPHVVTETDNLFLSTLYLVVFQSLEALKSAIRTYERATYSHYVVRDSHLHRDRKSYVGEMAVEHLAVPHSRVDGRG